MYEHITPEVIQERAARRVKTNLLTGEGSFFELHSKPVAMELSEGYHELDALHPKLYPGPEDGQYIDDAAAVDGITRKPATAAVIVVEFYGGNGAVIPAGTRLSDPDGVFYVTDAETAIGETGAAHATAVCETAGVIGNLSPGDPLRLLVSITRVQRAAALAVSARGVDAESDASLYERWTNHLRQPASSGNAYQIEQWALEITGIAHAKCIPVPNGPGTVGAIVATEDYLPPDEPTIAACLAHLYDELPAAGLQVTVEGVPVQEITVAGAVELNAGSDLDTVQAAFAEAVTAYLRGLAFSTGAEVVYNRITSLLMDVDGVSDFVSLTVNSGTSNIALPDYGSAVLTDLTLEVST